MKLLTKVLLAGALGSAAPAAAADKPEIVYQKHQVVVFDGSLLRGDLAKPDHAHIKSIKQRKWRWLIRVRQSWRRELLNSLRK